MKDIRDKIYMFAAETFEEADQTDQVGEAMYAFTTILSTQINCMTEDVEGVSFNYTQVLETLREQMEEMLLEKSNNPETTVLH